ncbi:substrate-binding domain-containing protein [Humisphaera borealis]|uniref:Substrate-binding domain-containing protein n=1 Tax=Humisphaera borealis TaxID=2807512 RepID=A0A7M2X2S7_9BACT|nr:substrate-binding domain-containing protein [Humisphaera borealis]QOV92023.1 substrate-binding domain-containing protein [Humisphaera borealis]
MTRKPRRVALMLDLQWPYKRHSQVFAGIQRYAEAQGWISVIDEFVHNTLPGRSGRAVPYDGIVARGNHRLATRAARLGVPVVNVWSSSPARHLIPGVFPDSTATGRLIAEHLLSRGFRAFATLTSPQNVVHDLEVKEFDRLVREAGFSCDKSFVPQDPYKDIASWRKTERLLQQAAKRWKPPVAVYVGEEFCARMLIEEAHRLGWRIPQDLAIIAGKNEETLCEQPRPSLTSVEIGYDRIGFAAAELLDRLMDGERPPTTPIRVPPHGLVVRESTDFYAVDDGVVASALEYISANSHRPIGIADVARAVGVERRTLQNYFRKSIDRPIATEIRRVRIERAKRELAQGDRPLSEIARDAGFGTMQRLYEVFRRELGMSPSDYRKQRTLDPAAGRKP